MTNNVNDLAIVLLGWQDSVNAYRLIAACGRATERNPLDLDDFDSFEDLCALYSATVREIGVALQTEPERKHLRKMLRNLISDPHRLCHLNGVAKLFDARAKFEAGDRRGALHAQVHSGVGLSQAHDLIHQGYVDFSKDMIRQTLQGDPRKAMSLCGSPENMQARFGAVVAFLCEVLFEHPDAESTRQLDSFADQAEKCKSSHVVWMQLRPELYS